MTTIDVATKLFAQTCIKCGMLFAFPSLYDEERRKDHAMFYCPAGHSQFYPGKTETEKLKEELAQVKQQREQEEAARIAAEDAAAKAQRALKRTKARVGAGSCPCCKRHFKALSRHMACKHPDYKKEKS